MQEVNNTQSSTSDKKERSPDEGNMAELKRQIDVFEESGYRFYMNLPEAFKRYFLRVYYNLLAKILIEEKLMEKEGL